jgi:rod shape-determining protein MreD
MQPTFLQRFDGFLRRQLPLALTLILVLFALTPTQIPGLTHVTPMYGLAAIYFWSIYRPDLIGYGASFGIGILEDLLTGSPLGSSALAYLVCQYVVFHQQKFFNAKPFGIFWLAFAVLAFAAGFMKWIAVGLVGQAGFTPFGDVFACVCMTAAVYPLIAWLLAQAQMRLMVQA